MPADEPARLALPAAFDLPTRAFADHWRCSVARRLDAAVHLAGGAAAAIAAPMLLLAERATGPWGTDPVAIDAVAIYALALALLFPASALFQHGPERWRDVTIKLDHAAIYLKIAASYGAIAAVSRVELGAALPGLWTMAIGGAWLRVLGPARMRSASLAFYLVVVLGGLAAIWPALASLSPGAYRLVMLGGAAYLTGMLFHLAEGLRFQQAIWHALVLVASMAVCAAVLTDLQRPI